VRGADAHEPDDVRRGIGQRVKAVGEDADRAARVAKRDLGCGYRDVEEKNPEEDAGYGGVPRGGWGARGLGDYG
jgi:hypothetical protein